jgi:hypothetical protein
MLYNEAMGKRSQIQRNWHSLHPTANSLISDKIQFLTDIAGQTKLAVATVECQAVRFIRVAAQRVSH